MWRNFQRRIFRAGDFQRDVLKAIIATHISCGVHRNVMLNFDVRGEETDRPICALPDTSLRRYRRLVRAVCFT